MNINWKKELEEWQPKKIKRVDRKSGRYYQSGFVKAPSVTTILSETVVNLGMERAKKELGPDVWKKVSQQGLRRGSIFHETVEVFFQTGRRGAQEYLVSKKENPGWEKGKHLWWQFYKSNLWQTVEKPYRQEIKLVNSDLNYGGTFDFLGIKNGFPLIVDFKTGKKMKTENEILTYKLQLGAYSLELARIFGQTFPGEIWMFTEKDEWTKFTFTIERIIKFQKAWKRVLALYNRGEKLNFES